MDTLPVPADGVLPLPRALQPTTYNITLNLSSIFSFSPTAFFSKIIRKSTHLGFRAADLPASSATSLEDWVAATTAAAIDSADILSSTPAVMLDASSAKTPAMTTPTFPGPWGFFTSGYMFGLFLMAFLLHRMQNVIIPSRSFRRRVAHTRSTNLALGSLRHIYLSLLPLNLSRTSTRLAVHLPSLYFLTKMLLLWFLLVLQTSDMFPRIDPETAERWHMGWVATLDTWSRNKDMSDICWSTFCAICGAFSVEGFVRALDGIGGGFPLAGNMNPNTSPFNLVGYAFLLHIYSSPITHVQKEDGFPSRPDKHVMITITIPLLQLTIFHYLSVSKRLSSHRLLPTMLTSFLSLTHFHSTLFSHFWFPSARPAPSSSTPPPPLPANGKSGPSYHRYMTTQSTPNYPLLNYIPNIFETLLILTILFSVCLNALAQLLVRGRIERLFSGLGLSPGGGYEDDVFGIHLPYDEDFGVVLLRMGTASLEATGLRGWGNEVAPISIPVPGQVQAQQQLELPENEYGMVRMGRTGVGSVHPSYAVGNRGKKMRLGGFRNEVRRVDVGVASEGGGRRGGWLVWCRLLWKFLVTLWGVGKGAGRWVWSWARAGLKRQRETVERGVGMEDVGDYKEEDADVEEEEEDIYGRFLRDEDISDDEDDEVDAFDEVDDYEDDEDEYDEVDGEGEDDAETAALIRDLVRSSADGSEVVLAHILHGSRGQTSPLTRRRWGTLARRRGRAVSVSDDELSEGEVYFRRRAHAPPVDMERENARHWCVICTSEAREIICWPCRCLAMCDGCREALATRSAPAKHRCPCCRQLVEGYSRVFIP